MSSVVNISNALLIDGWTSEQELTWLAQQACKINNGKIVEIGVYLGRSACAIADNMEQHTCLWCIDPYVCFYDPVIDFSNGKGDAIFSAAIENLEELKNVNIRRETSETATLMFDEKSIDMVFIDGEHTYDSVKSDINAWLTKVKPGGLICGHDYGGYPGVKLAVEACLMIDDVYFPAGSIWAYNLRGQNV